MRLLEILVGEYEPRHLRWGETTCEHVLTWDWHRRRADSALKIGAWCWWSDWNPRVNILLRKSECKLLRLWLLVLLLLRSCSNISLLHLDIDFLLWLLRLSLYLLRFLHSSSFPAFIFRFWFLFLLLCLFDKRFLRLLLNLALFLSRCRYLGLLFCNNHSWLCCWLIRLKRELLPIILDDVLLRRLKWCYSSLTLEELSLGHYDGLASSLRSLFPH
jgi:hypothetical protein